MTPQNMREYLSTDAVAQIHQTSMRLLENVGVDFPHSEAVAVFKRHGVKTAGTLVYLTEAQLLKALATVPQQFTIHARNPVHDVTVGGGRTVFAPAYGAPFLIDAMEGKRAPTLADYHALVKLAHALPNQDMSGHLLVEPGGVDADTAHVQMLYAHMLHSDKAFIGNSADKKGAQLTLEMARILFGEELNLSLIHI